MLTRKYLTRHKATLEFEIKDAQGNPVDISDKTVKLLIAKTPGETPVISKDCTINIEETGKCDVILTKEDTDIPFGTYHAQLSIIDSQQEPEATVFQNDFQALFIFEESIL